jgi:16S rRNA (uracil1498-N3)-methyltransferase
MAQERRRLLIAPERLTPAAEGSVELTADESRYLTRVLRLGPGDGFAITDGEGSLWEARLQGRDQALLEQPLAAPLQRVEPPRPELVLAAAVVKRDYDVVVRMAVELGVDRLQPLITERTAVLGQLKAERWRAIAREAAEQCERLWLPQVAEPQPARQAMVVAAAAPHSLRLWATTRRQGLASLEEVLQQQRVDAPPTALWLACGPEGGWSDEEEAEAEQQGWIPVALGPRILRSSTAAVAALTLVSSWRYGCWGC